MRNSIHFIFGLIGSLFFGILTTYAQTGPGGVGNATGSGGMPRNKLWLRADAGVFNDAGSTAAVDNDLVYQWGDQSSNICTPTQPTSGSRPTYKTNILNGYPVIRFNGTSNELLFASTLDNSNALPMGFFAVTKNTTNPKGLFDSRPYSADVFRFYNDGSGAGNNNSVEFWNNNPSKGGLTLSSSGSVVSVIGSLGASSVRQLDAYISGSQIGTISTGTNTAVGFTSCRLGSINGGSGGWLNGDVAEVVYFSTSINAAQRVIVENYLGAKYGLTLTANDYFANTTYTQDLIGIGTADGTLKQSASNAGALLLTESSTTLNAANEYLFAGHNGTTHSVSTGSYLANPTLTAAGVTTRWAREYRIEKTGSVDATIGFDYAQAGLTRVSGTASDYVLLYRASTGSTNYTMVTLSGSADVSVANRVSFTVLNANLASGYYTLGLKSSIPATTLYSYTTNCGGGCNLETASSWTTDPTGATSVSPMAPRNIDNIVILNGNTVNANGTFSVITATINSGGTLDLGSSGSCSFMTLNGAGTLKLSATSGTLVFPTITTNNFITTSGSTVDYNSNNTFSLPASPATYRNLTVSGGGIKSIASALTISEAFTIQPPTTCNTNSNLNLNGNFVNNGQLNQSSGTTTFGGSGAQSLSGAPTTTIFNHFTISNTGATVSSSIDFTIAGDFTNSSNFATAFNATNGTVILSSGSAQSIGGAGTGTVNFYNLYTSGAGVKTINRTFNVTNLLSPLSGSTLQFPAGTVRTVTINDLTNAGTFSMGTPGAATSHILNITGNVVLNNSSVFNMVNGNNVANVTFTKAGAQTISGTTPTTVDLNNLTVNSTSQTTLSSFNLVIRSLLTVNGTLDLGAQTANRASAGGTLLIAATGILKIGGTNTFPINYTTNTLTAGSTVEYSGTNQNITAFTYSNLTTSGSSTKTLSGSVTVSDVLTLTNGIIDLGTYNLILPIGSSTTGTPSATSFIQTTSTGVIRKYFKTAGSFTLPTGSGSVYTPLTLNVTAMAGTGGANSRYVSVRSIGTVAPSQLDATYSISKHWITSVTNITSVTGTMTCTYDASEADPTAEPMFGNARYNGGAWTVGATSTVASRVITFTLAASTLTGTWTAGPNVDFIAGSFYSIASADFETGSTWSQVGYAGAASSIPPTVGSTVNIGNGRTVTAAAGSKTLTIVTIDPTGTLDLGTTTGNTITTLNGSGTLRITGLAAGTAVFPTVTNNNFITTANNTVEYYGTDSYNLPAAPTTYRKLAITGSGSTRLILANTTVSQTLILNSGLLALGNMNLSIAPTATLAGNSPSATNMILVNGTGAVLKYFDAAGSFNYPVGSPGVYSPVNLTINSAVFTPFTVGARYISVRPVATTAPNQLDASYSLTKYWELASTNMSIINHTIDFTYDLTERNAVAEPSYVSAFWNGSAWATGTVGSVVSPVVNINTTALVNLNGNYTAGPLVAFTAGTFYSIANASFETGSTWSQVGYAGAASLIPPTIGSTVNIGNNRTVTATVGSKTLTTLNVVATGVLDFSTTTGNTITTLNGAGTLRITATGGTAVFPSVTTNNFISAAGSTVEYYGTSNYFLPAAPASYINLVLTGASTKDLSASTTVSTALTFNSGLLRIGNFNLVFDVGSTYSGTLSSTNMVVTNGTGVVRRNLNSNSSFTFPVGTGSVYTPATINITSATYGFGTRYIDVRAINTVAPSQLDATYSLTKYWAVATTNLSNISATLNLTYDLSERNATAEPIYVPGFWNGVSWNTTGTVVSPTATVSRTGLANLNGNWTVGPQVAFTAGNFYSIANANWETGSTWSLSGFAGAATVIPPTLGSTVNIGNNRTVTVSANTKNLTTVDVAGGGTPGTLDFGTATGITINTLSGSGRIRITASAGTAVFPTVTSNTFIGTTGNIVEYYGTSNYNLPSTPATYLNLIVTGSGKKTLSAAASVNTLLTLNSSVLDLGNFNLSLPVGSNYAGTPSGTNKIATSGSGSVRKYFDAIGNFTFPIGTGSVYTPAFVNLTAATFGGGNGSRYVDVRAVNTSAPSQLDATYSLTKYWAVSTTNLSGINASLNFTYDLTERNAAAEPIYVSGYYNGSTWTAGIIGSVVSPVVSFTRSAVANLNGNWTAGPGGAFLPGVFYTKGTGSFETAANWSQVSYGGPTSLVPPLNGSDVYVGNGQSVTLNAGTRNFPTFQIDPTGTFDIQTNTGIAITTLNGSGRLRLSASGGTAVFPTITNNNYIATAGNTVEYYGTSNYNIPAGITSFQNLALTGSGVKTLTATTTIVNNLEMNSGILDLANFDINFPVGSNLTGNTASNSNFIRTSGTGNVRRYFDAAGSFNFPIGTGSVYTPYNLTFTTATFGGAAGSRYLDVRAIASVAPSQLDGSYSISKYWITNTTNLTNVNGTVTATYAAAEANANPAIEAIYGSAYYNGSIWATGATSSVASRVITFPLTGSTLTGNWTAGPNVGFLPGNFYSFATGTYETASTWSLTAYAGPVSPIPPTLGSSVFIGNNRTVTTTAGSKTIPSVTIDGLPNPGTLDIQSFTGFTFTTLNGSGTLRLSAPGGTAVLPTVTTNNFIATANSNIEYYGSGSYSLPLTPTTYQSLALSGTGTKTMPATITVNNVLTMNGGILDIGAFNLVLPVGNTLAGNAGSTTNFIRTSGTGVIRKYFDAPGSFNFQIGTGSVYTPYNLTISSATFGGGAGSRYIDIRAINTLAPSQLDNTYSITKYWITSTTNISNANGTVTATYAAAEANANPAIEAIYGSAYYNGTVWTTGATSTVVGRVITFPLTASTIIGTWTAGPNVGFLPGTFYSFATGNYETASTWSLTAYAGPVSPIPPTIGSNVSIGNNRTVTTTAGSKTIPTVTIDGAPNPGTLDLQAFTGFNISTLNGSGNLQITTAGATAVFPTVTTNNFISTAGSKVDYYGAATYSLPAAPLTYRNLTLSGIGAIKSLAGNTTVSENLVVSSGSLELADRTFTVLGTTTNSGSITDNNDTGTNTFTGNIINNASGSISTTNNSPFVFGGGINNNGTFSKSGTGAVTFNTGNQTINGSNPIAMSGTITISNGVILTNQNNGFPITNLNIAQNSKFLQSYSSFPTAYTTSNDGLAINTKFNSLAASNNAGNAVSTVTGDDILLTRGGSGDVYGLRSSTLAPSSTVQVVRFTVSTTSTGAQNNAATLLIGSGFADNNTVHAATARLQLNLDATSGSFSLTHPDGTPTTSTVVSGTQIVTWVINNSASTVTYSPPTNTTSLALAANRADVWVGNTRFATGLAVQTAAQAMGQMKVIFNAGTGSVTINSLQINPLGTINTSALAQGCYQVTPYDGDSILIPFTTPVTVTTSTHFNSANTFTAQLSNSAGSFASPTTLGTLTTNALSGTIDGFIPANYASGSGYRVRVVSNLPVSIANDNGTNFIINQFKITPAPSQVITTSGTGNLLTATGTGVTAYQWCYYTVLGGPITDLAGKTSSTYTPYGPDFPGAGTYSLVCRMTTAGACGTSYSNYVAVYINCPVTANLVVNGDFSSGNTGFTSQYNYVADDPMVQNEMYPEQTYGVVDNPRNLHTAFCNMTTPALRSPGSAGNMLVGNAATSGSLNLWTQNIPVTANTDYVLTFNAVSLAGTESSLLFGIYTGCYRTGADISVPFETFNCVWQKYSFQFNSGNNTTIPLSIVNISAQASGNDIAIDDITVYACASVSSPPFVVANAPYWRGISSDWFNKDNWGTTCSLPTCADDVYIPLLGSGKVYPTINAAGAAAKTVQIRTGAKLTINSTYNLNICGDLDNSGTLTAATTSSVTFIGSSNPASMMGNMTGVSKFGSVIVNKTNASDTVKMAANTEISGSLTITKGQFKQKGYSIKLGGSFSNAGTYFHNNGSLEMNGATNASVTRTGTGNFYDVKINKTTATNTVTFNPAVSTIDHQLDLSMGQVVTSGSNEVSVTNTAASGVINYSGNSYVRGRLRRSVSGVTNYDFPVGDATRYQLLNMNVTTSLVGTSNILGYFNSASAPGTIPSLNEGDKFYQYVCTNGYWTLTPNAQPSSGLFNLTINPVGFGCSQPYQTIAKRANSASAWTFGGSTPISFTQRNGFSSFSEIAQIDAEEPLPVNLISFTGRWKGQTVLLNWSTASEMENAYFDIEKSADGQVFEKIGSVESKMKFSVANHYDFIDPNPGAGLRFYRLKQVDLDGKFEYSRVVKVRNSLSSDMVVMAPNPISTGQNTVLEFTEGAASSYEIRLVNSAGKTIATEIIESKAGENQIGVFKKHHVSSGIYMVFFIPIGDSSTSSNIPLKLVVE